MMTCVNYRQPNRFVFTKPFDSQAHGFDVSIRTSRTCFIVLRFAGLLNGLLPTLAGKSHTLLDSTWAR